MCGRYNFRGTSLDVAAVLQAQLEEGLEYSPRYNIAPTQQVLGVRLIEEERVASLFKWGLIPSWAKDAKIGSGMINARAETVAEKPAFRTAFKRRRCLIPSTGFYEWQRDGKTKQPFHISMGDDIFCFAGLWESWQGVESCTIITTEANAQMQTLHDRMPVILHPDTFGVWLDPEIEPAELKSLLLPYTGSLNIICVNSVVNNARNETPECIEPKAP